MRRRDPYTAAERGEPVYVKRGDSYHPIGEVTDIAGRHAVGTGEYLGADGYAVTVPDHTFATALKLQPLDPKERP